MSLNIGGRNTNTFEFEMLGDDTPLARRWALGTLALRDPYSDDQGAFNRIFEGGAAGGGGMSYPGMYPVRA